MILILVFGGRAVRHHLLVGPEGSWRSHLWLDTLVTSRALADAEPAPEKPRLTLPLPINSCSQDSLTLLPGVGPVLALRIDEVRRTGIVFHAAEDLKQVKGIGPALSSKLGPLIDFQVEMPLSAAPDSLLSP